MKKADRNRSSHSRREFLGSLAAGIGVSAVLPTVYASGESGVDQAPRPPANLRVLESSSGTSGTVLTAKDLVYKGCFALPQDLSDAMSTGTSYGTITLRRVSGKLNLLTTGRDVPNAGGSPDQVYEAEVPTTLSPDADTAIKNDNRARFVRWWGDVYQGKRLYNNLAAGNPSFLGGLQWDDNRQGIWLAYKDVYGINANDPSLIFTRLNADGSVRAFGPWRTTAGSHMTGGYMALLPPEFSNRADLAKTLFAGKRLILSAMYGSGGGASPWGINGHVMLSEPSETTPPDPVDDRSKASVPVSVLAQFDINNLQPAPSALRRGVCDSMLYHQGEAGYPNPNLPLGAAQPVLGPVGPAGTAGNVYNDYITSTAWVNTSSGKQAVIFATSFVDGVTEDAHAWYGSDTCVHGKKDPWHQATGPGATVRRVGLFIYDQNDFAKVARGEMDRTKLRETAYLPMRSLVADVDNSTIATGSLRLAFDRQTNQLFVSEAARDWSNIYAGKAIIRVFQL
jgi:hypothetical protein